MNALIERAKRDAAALRRQMNLGDYVLDDRLEAAADTLEAFARIADDLPRLIELQRTAAPEDKAEDAWNAALDRAAAIARDAVAASPPATEGVSELS